MPVLALLGIHTRNGKTRRPMRLTVVTCYHNLAAIDRLDSSLASRLAAFERIEVVGGDRRVR